ncbi:hypothetical protein [Paenibacillus sp. 32352]|nr:hypothetical protein [Paenibacillus sp. 32352]
MEINTLLNELFSSQEDWSVKTNEHSYIVVPNEPSKEEDDKEERA